MKFKTNVNIFGLGAGVEFEAEHTEFLQNHVDGGKISLVLPDEDSENGQRGSSDPEDIIGGAGAQPPVPDAAEGSSDLGVEPDAE